MNTQTMAASDGTYRANYGANRLPWQIGSVWYSHEQLSSGSSPISMRARATPGRFL
ncbi:MAG: hypothetical protein ACLTXH_11080 [Enterobacter hormaechei]